MHNIMQHSRNNPNYITATEWQTDIREYIDEHTCRHCDPLKRQKSSSINSTISSPIWIN